MTYPHNYSVPHMFLLEQNKNVNKYLGYPLGVRDEY